MTNLMTGSPNNRWKHGTRGVITGETGLAHAGAVIDDQCGNVFVAHFSIGFLQKKKKTV